VDVGSKRKNEGMVDNDVAKIGGCGRVGDLVRFLYISFGDVLIMSSFSECF
jgi:hypothetical protein